MEKADLEMIEYGTNKEERHFYLGIMESTLSVAFTHATRLTCRCWAHIFTFGTPESAANNRSTRAWKHSHGPVCAFFAFSIQTGAVGACRWGVKVRSCAADSVPCEGLVLSVFGADDPLVHSSAFLAFCCAGRRVLNAIVDSIRRLHVCLQSFCENMTDWGAWAENFPWESYFCCLGERVPDLSGGTLRLFNVDSHVELVRLALRGCYGLPLPDSIIAFNDCKTFELVVCLKIFQVYAFQLLSKVVYIPSLKRVQFVCEIIGFVHLDIVSFGQHERADFVFVQSNIRQIVSVVPTSDWVVRVPVNSRSFTSATSKLEQIDGSHFWWIVRTHIHIGHVVVKVRIVAIRIFEIKVHVVARATVWVVTSAHARVMRAMSAHVEPDVFAAVVRRQFIIPATLACFCGNPEASLWIFVANFFSQTFEASQCVEVAAVVARVFHLGSYSLAEVKKGPLRRCDKVIWSIWSPMRDQVIMLIHCLFVLIVYTLSESAGFYMVPNKPKNR